MKKTEYQKVNTDNMRKRVSLQFISPFCFNIC